VTTIDLLLTLGSQVANITTTLLNKNVSKKERQKAENLLQQYNQISEAHGQIQALIQQYNQGIVRMMANGGMQELFPLCTHQGYQKVEQLYQSLLHYQISNQLLEFLDVLSVSLMTQESRIIRFNSMDIFSYQKAAAYTREKWTTYYATGQTSSEEVINLYQLVWSNDGWKMDGNQVFRKVA
jgi:hypothetical protein